MQGFGIFNTTANAPYSAGPPFPGSAAENGLSVDPVTGRIVLGEDAFSGSGLATLLSSREIPMNGSNIFLSDNGFNSLTLLSANNIVNVEAVTQSRAEMAAFNTGAFMAVESDSVVTTPPRLTLTDVSVIPHWVANIEQNGSEFAITQNTAPVKVLTADQFLGLYKFGDIDTGNNGTQLSLDDALQWVRIDSGGNLGLFMDFPNNYYEFGQTPTNNSFAVVPGTAHVWLSGGNALLLDFNTSIYAMGDVDGNANSTTLGIDDNTQTILLAAGNGFHTSPPNGLGSDGLWRLGKPVAAAVAFDATQYVEVNINGTLVKLAVAV